MVGGKVLELSRLYSVGVKEYLVQGKDGFDCLKDVRLLVKLPLLKPGYAALYHIPL